MIILRHFGVTLTSVPYLISPNPSQTSYNKSKYGFARKKSDKNHQKALYADEDAADSCEVAKNF